MLEKYKLVCLQLSFLEDEREEKPHGAFDDASLESLEDNDLLQWAEDRLKIGSGADRRSGATTNTSRAAKLLPFLSMKSIVNYDKQNGIKFSIVGAFALDAKEQVSQLGRKIKKKYPE